RGSRARVPAVAEARVLPRRTVGAAAPPSPIRSPKQVVSFEVRSSVSVGQMVEMMAPIGARYPGPCLGKLHARWGEPTRSRGGRILPSGAVSASLTSAPRYLQCDGLLPEDFIDPVRP